MSDKVFVYTTEKNTVSICYPTPWIMQILTGAGWPTILPMKDRLIANSVNAGRKEKDAVKWINALISGQKTDAEAYELIILRSIPETGKAIELVDKNTISKNRLYRNAWSRSHNGGPIYINLEKAKKIDLFRLPRLLKNTIAEIELEEQEFELQGKVPTNRLSSLKQLDLRKIGENFRTAKTLLQLCKAWPACIKKTELTPESV